MARKVPRCSARSRPSCGGILSSIALTLVVLPVLYSLVERRAKWNLGSPASAEPVL